MDRTSAITTYTMDASLTLSSITRLTEPAICTARHEWMIQNFSRFWKEDGNSYHSSLQSSNFCGSDEDEWHLKLWLNGKRNPDYLSIDLWCDRWPNCNVKLNEKGVEVVYCFSILNYSLVPVYKSCSTLRPKIGENECQELIPKNYLMENRSSLLTEDSLTILCEITTSIHQPFQLPHSNVIDDWNTIFVNQAPFEAVTIEADGKEFYNGQGILRVRCPAMAAIIDGIETKRLVIEDVKHEVVYELLTYIHTDTAPNVKDMARDLLGLADKFDLERLKMMCEEVLRGELTEKNAIDVLILADTCSAARLKKNVINFIAANRSNTLTLESAQTRLVAANRSNLLAEVTPVLSTPYNARNARSEATFSFKKKNFSKMRGKVLSPPYIIRNLPWKIMIKRTTSNYSQTSLSFFLQCNGESKGSIWSCDASAELVILSQKEGVDNFVRKISHVFYPKEYDWGFHHFLGWNEVMDPEKGFIKDDTVIFRVHVQAETPYFSSPIS